MKRALVFMLGLLMAVSILGCGSLFGGESTKPVVSQYTTTSDKQEKEITIADLKNTDNFSHSALEHIFYGEINKKNKVVGYHYEGMKAAKARVEENSRSAPDSQGIYRGKVYIGDKVKEGNNGYSTFFPKNWTPQQVVDAINYAYMHKEKKTESLYMGLTKEGIEINFYTDSKTGKITTAFPVQKR